MKLALTLEADSINVQALNMGRIVVDVDGVNLAELINVACDNGYPLRVVDESDRTSAERTPPFAALTGIRCSTAHITEKDNAWLYSLSHQTNDFGESEWIHFTGSGYLLRTYQPGLGACTCSQLINSIDIVRARRATGLMTRDNYRTVNNITLGKHPEAKR